jgi:hypothetical protein
MMSFKDLVNQYKKKQKSCAVDTITAGLSLADELSVDLGLLESSGILSDMLNAFSFGLPLTIIAVTEGGNVLLGRKTQTAGFYDAAYRMVKTGAAMGAGAVAAGLGAGALPAIPIAMGVRMALDQWRSKALTGRRVQQRTRRLQALLAQRAQRALPAIARLAQTDTL